MITVNSKKKYSTIEIVAKGWKVLNKNLGPATASEFIRIFSHGAGDSVKYYKELWEGKSIKEIHTTVMRAKKLK